MKSERSRAGRPCPFASITLAAALLLLSSGCSILNFEPTTDIDTQRLKRAIAEDDGNAHAHFELGQAMLDIGEPGKARKHFARARQISPAFIEAWDGEGIALLDAKKYQDALFVYESMAREFPDSPAAFEGQALAHFYGRDYTLCDKAARSALERDPQSAVALRLLGETAYIRKEYSAAAEYWNAAVKADGVLAASLDPMIESIRRTTPK